MLRKILVAAYGVSLVLGVEPGDSVRILTGDWRGCTGIVMNNKNGVFEVNVDDGMRWDRGFYEERDMKKITPKVSKNGIALGRLTPPESPRLPVPGTRAQEKIVKTAKPLETSGRFKGLPTAWAKYIQDNKIQKAHYIDGGICTPLHFEEWEDSSIRYELNREMKRRRGVWTGALTVDPKIPLWIEKAKVHDDKAETESQSASMSTSTTNKRHGCGPISVTALSLGKDGSCRVRHEPAVKQSSMQQPDYKIKTGHGDWKLECPGYIFNDATVPEPKYIKPAYTRTRESHKDGRNVWEGPILKIHRWSSYGKQLPCIGVVPETQCVLPVLFFKTPKEDGLHEMVVCKIVEGIKPEDIAAGKIALADYDEQTLSFSSRDPFVIPAEFLENMDVIDKRRGSKKGQCIIGFCFPSRTTQTEKGKAGRRAQVRRGMGRSSRTTMGTIQEEDDTEEDSDSSWEISSVRGNRV